MLTVDYRERALRDALALEHGVASLPVGDLVCRYPDGTGWIAERKTAGDLARSVIYLCVLALYIVFCLPVLVCVHRGHRRPME